MAADMSSLADCARRSVERDQLLESWLTRLLDGYARLAGGSFDGRGWAAAQATSGAHVVVLTRGRRLEGVGLGVDLATGALLLQETGSGARHAVPVGDVTACRVSPPGLGL
jgi:biotin-(acetyl-CoA carboxylase) ligase